MMGMMAFIIHESMGFLISFSVYNVLSREHFVARYLISGLGLTQASLSSEESSTSHEISSTGFSSQLSSNSVDGKTSSNRQSTPGIRSEYSLQNVLSVLPSPWRSNEGSRSR